MVQHPRLHVIPGGRDDRPRVASAEPGRESVLPQTVPPRREPGPQPVPIDEPLWREALGRRFRALRTEQGETLVETAGRAGVSPQYLSEVERGRKDPSSEMIAALAGALGTTLIGLTEQVVRDLGRPRPTAIAPHRRPGPAMLALAA
ncbi:helix-turn-helix domain-containing protein [Nocardia alni]|uniref:helix-turn-helix domain-containing protein n=1 Tax=Nocardia alni TaxID=2815723 RepID=UPI001C23A8AD|nr:helix-turn-helix transcriptional regulator [Nocardia alni]